MVYISQKDKDSFVTINLVINMDRMSDKKNNNIKSQPLYLL